MTDYNILIDEETWAFIERTNSFYPPETIDYTIDQQREVYNRMCREFFTGYPDGVSAETKTITLADRHIPVRRYRAMRYDAHAVVIYYHGGGFVVGGLESHDDVCAEICARTGFEVVSVDYRLAPEHKHPAAFDDALAAFKWVARGYKNPLLLCGDSAGGNLAAGLALRARDEGLPGVVGQVLIYPALGGDLSAGSYVEMAAAPGLTTADVAYYREILQAPAGSEIAEPLNASSLAGLPPTYITVAHFDPLRDDGRQYAARLAAEGVEVSFREEPQMVHAWLRARHMSEGARDGFHAVCEAVRHFASA